jgi:5-methyltetrahydrofolate--homocysteine methyltransferase
LSEAVEEGAANLARERATALLAEGVEAEEVLRFGLLDAMERVGQRFKTSEIFVPEVLLAARAMQAGLSVIEPRLRRNAIGSRGTLLLGTVEGDLHSLGKNLVRIFAKSAGFTVIDLGVDVAPGVFLDAAKRHPEATVVGMSALLTTTMPIMRTVIERFEAEGLRSRFRFIVGGAPVSERYASEIGADGFGPDAATAADQLKAWASEQRPTAGRGA